MTEYRTYLVVDLKRYSVSFLDDVPAGGWSDEYKTVKLVLRYIPAGSFIMGSSEEEYNGWFDETQHKVTLTRPFYIGVFQMTQKQYEIVTGENPSANKNGDTHPVELLTYDDIRGYEKGSQWPRNNKVDDFSFLGKLRARTKLDFDLPTEAQWEYACRAGTTTAWNNGTEMVDWDRDPNLDKLGRYHMGNEWVDGKRICHAPVGSYLPNAWGLYDMHGNVDEWVLDFYNDDISKRAVKDPKGPNNDGARVKRGGGCYSDAVECRSASRDYSYNGCATGSSGFRLALPL